MSNFFSITDPSVLTMSSREISELTAKRHDNVMRVCRELKATGVTPQIEELDFEHNGNTYKEFKLNKRDSLVIVARLSPEFTARVIDRWQALESQQPAIDPMKALSDPATMRSLLLSYTEKVMTLENKVEELAPKAHALDLISADKDALTITEIAKILGVKRKDLTTRLHAEGWIYRLNGAWVAYDKYIKNGCLAHKEAKYTDDKTGLECRKPYCHVTPKGLTKLARMYSIELEAA